MNRRFDPRDLALRGRIGAYRMHASRDPRETTAKARATFRNSFEKLVDPESRLPAAERLRRADAANPRLTTPVSRGSVPTPAESDARANRWQVVPASARELLHVPRRSRRLGRGSRCEFAERDGDPITRELRGFSLAHR